MPNPTIRYFRRESQAIAALPSPPSIEMVKAGIPHILLPEEISKKYREAIVHYSKYQYAGIIETEASFKATRISIEQNCTLQAASYLNNVVLINLHLSEQEKVRTVDVMRYRIDFKIKGTLKYYIDKTF